jgi:hypothetical protein
MLHPIAPLPDVFATIRPLKQSIAMLQVFLVVATVAFAIRPFEEAFPMHFLVSVPAGVLATIVPPKHTFALDYTSNQLTSVGVTIGPFVSTLAPLEPILVNTREFGAIDPFLFALAMLLVFFPISSVGTLGSSEYSISLLHTLLPITFVHRSTLINEPSTTLSLVIIPVSIISTAGFTPDEAATTFSYILVVVVFAFINTLLVDNF